MKGGRQENVGWIEGKSARTGKVVSHVLCSGATIPRLILAPSEAQAKVLGEKHCKGAVRWVDQKEWESITGQDQTKRETPGNGPIGRPRNSQRKTMGRMERKQRMLGIVSDEREGKMGTVTGGRYIGAQKGDIITLATEFMGVEPGERLIVTGWRISGPDKAVPKFVTTVEGRDMPEFEVPQALCEFVEHNPEMKKARQQRGRRNTEKAAESAGEEQEMANSTKPATRKTTAKPSTKKSTAKATSGTAAKRAAAKGHRAPEDAKIGKLPKGVKRITGRTAEQRERNYAAVVAVVEKGESPADVGKKQGRSAAQINRVVKLAKGELEPDREF